jgi:cytochrome c-type biogenesis protein CcmF
MRPELGVFDSKIDRADRRIPQLVDRIAPAQAPPAMRAQLTSSLQGTVIRNIRKDYVAHPPPAEFRVNVNPLVIWIWIGGAVAVLGALFAVWPTPPAPQRRVSDVYAARLARELGRA